MDGWLKGLIATACVVVIAGGGYFAFSEYRRSQEQEVAKAAADRRALIVACKQMIMDLSKNETKDYKGGYIATCINDGYVTEQEFKDAGAGGYVDTVRSLIRPAAE